MCDINGKDNFVLIDYVQDRSEILKRFEKISLVLSSRLLYTFQLLILKGLFCTTQTGVSGILVASVPLGSMRISDCDVENTSSTINQTYNLEMNPIPFQ